MIRLACPALLLAACLLSACKSQPTAASSPGTELATGTVKFISEDHGNAYTSIEPARYETLGLRPGMQLHVTFTDVAMTMTVAENYTDVPTGDPVAVLHREGLTLAINHGNFAETHNIEMGDAFTIATVK